MVNAITVIPVSLLLLFVYSGHNLERTIDIVNVVITMAMVLLQTPTTLQGSVFNKRGISEPSGIINGS